MSNSSPTQISIAAGPLRTGVAGLSRANLILALILLGQIAITAYLYWPSQGPATGGEPILGGITADAVTALTVTDNNERSVSFVKEGDTWTLAGTDGYPARPTKISETLDKLVAIPMNRLVTRTEGSHDRLQVAEDNYLRKVDVTTADGTQTLYFGSSTGASATHVRRAEDNATYLTSDIATWELDTLETTWIDVAYFRVPKDQITEITLENANGTFTFVPNKDGETTTWTLADATEDEPIASANISTLVDRIATLNLHSVLGKEAAPEYGLNTPLATITVTASETTSDTTDAELATTTLWVGAKDDELNTYYLKSEDSEFYVRLAAYTGNEFVNKQRSDFMIKSSEAEGDDADGESAAPAVDDTGVVTGTEPLDEQEVATTTVEATDTLTATDGTSDVSAGEAVTTTEEAATEEATTEEAAETATPDASATPEE